MDPQTADHGNDGNTRSTTERLLHGDVTDRVVKSFFVVYNTLGAGFVESVYQRALAEQLRRAGKQRRRSDWPKHTPNKY